MRDKIFEKFYELLELIEKKPSLYGYQIMYKGKMWEVHKLSDEQTMIENEEVN